VIDPTCKQNPYPWSPHFAARLQAASPRLYARLVAGDQTNDLLVRAASNRLEAQEAQLEGWIDAEPQPA